MRKTITFLTKRLLYSSFFCLLLSSQLLVAQTLVSGHVDEEDGGDMIGVNIVLENTVTGTTTDTDGNFKLKVNAMPPFKLVFSAVGYQTQKIEVTENDQILNVTLKSKSILTDEVVISASRVEERLLESPVSIQKMDALAVRNTASANFYDNIENLKGVQLNTNSLTFKSVNTRGFAAFGNTRFVQVVDGMDNAAPGLNFPAGNFVGISELDVASVELVPGAASALYGPNAFNGILFLNSKNPFYSQGLSAYVKGGITVQEAAGTNPFYDVGVRYAKTFLNDRLAFKVNFSALQGTDWWANDFSDVNAPANIEGLSRSPGYDGVNTYGDEVATSLPLQPDGSSILVSRTGYKEQDLVNYNAASYKADAALHYRITDNIEVLYNYRVGFGQTIYQGANRYAFMDLNLQQHKLELRGDNFFVRAYTSLENAGNSADTRFAGWNINRAAKGDLDWFTDYTLAYLGLIGSIYPDLESQNHDVARAFADNNLLNNDIIGEENAGRLATTLRFLGFLGENEPWDRNDVPRLVPGTPEFEEAKERVYDTPDLATGAKFIDRSRLTHVEGNYNFKNKIDFLDLQVGSSFRQYYLNSEGTIFTDADAPISISEFGAYAQAAKRLLNDRLKLTASLRYDKNQNFKGQFTPRASAVYSLGVNREHNFRASFQTGFRNPETQSQFIGLDIGVATLVGGAEENIQDYTIDIDYIDPEGAAQTAMVTGDAIYNNSYTNSSANAYLASGAVNDLQKMDLDFIKPEQIVSFEVGYKGIIAEKILADVNYYYNQYTDFQANFNAAHPLVGNVDDGTAVSAIDEGDWHIFQLYANANGKVQSQGFGVSLDYVLPRNFTLGGTYSFATLSLDEDANPDLIPGFNTPKHRFGITFSNREVIKNLGFNLAFRWSDSYLWESSFGVGTVNSYHTLDAQLSYKIPKLKTILKVGGANILNREYRQAIGTGNVGAQYYVSLTFDELLN